MKKRSLFLALMLITASLSTLWAQSPRITVESPSKHVKVAYGQPSKRERVIFGPEGSASLEKYGRVWRTGANQGTEITFAKDVTFGDKKIKAGSYTLFTIPGEKEWTVILNSVLNQSGSHEYEKNKDKNVAEVKVPAKTTSNIVEKLTITPTDTQVSISWDKTSISVPLKM